MKTQKHIFPSMFFICFLVHGGIILVHSNSLPIFGNQPNKKMQVYIVYLQKPQGTEFLHFKDRVSWYKSFLPNTTLDSGKPRMIYAYSPNINGFAARLTEDGVNAMENMQGFVSAHPENNYSPLTTHSPSFLGLNQGSGLWPDSSMGQSQVIGVIDTGIKPTHPSFRDDDNPMPSPPTKWQGKCYWGKPICNNKLIGAIGFQNGITVRPTDSNGHGTHCASTAAGSFVQNANVLGQGLGTASGMAPKAHLAVYKAMHELNGPGSDILKCIDQAVRDHVDILSMSLGFKNAMLDQSEVVVGSFAAVKQGIIPVAAAGNDGPNPSIITNDAPWILTVGASNIDRSVVATLTLGNGKQYVGQATFEAEIGFSTGQLPLVYPGVLKTQETLNCKKGSMAKFNVTGKIVLCGVGQILNSKKSDVVRDAGGAGMILMNQPWNSLTLQSEPHKIPTVNINFDDAWELLKKYIETDPKPTAAISFQGTQMGRPAPTLGSFSSRGPSLHNGNILKPDVIAPGTNILAAWPFEVSANHTNNTKTFTFATGTSMAAPHIAGIVALLKNNHPDWSPAAIKSALMTTAYVVDRNGRPIKDDYNGTKATVFGIGAGHVDPVAANNPGLVYDIEFHDYIAYLCGSNFTDIQVSTIVRGPVSCTSVTKIDSDQLNYPSISISLKANSKRTIKRTLKNVGNADSSYAVKFDEPEGVSMDFNPATLKFNQVGQELSYEVTFSMKDGFKPADKYSEGYLAWDSGKYYVRSPIAVSFT